MGEQWQRDPKTLDYVIESGAPAKTDPGDLKIPAFIRLRCPREKWMYAPNRQYGSRLREVKKNNMTSPHSVQLTETLAAQALSPMVDDGRATEVQATVVEQGRAQGIGFVVVIISKNGQPQQIELPSVG